MKTLTTEQMIELLPLAPSALDKATIEFARVLPEFSDTEAQLREGVERGWMNTVAIWKDGFPEFNVWYHKSANGFLVVNGVQRLSNRSDIETLFAGIDVLGRREGCAYLTGNARRPGLVRMLINDGWQPLGLTLFKKLEAQHG